MPREILVNWTTPSGSDHRSVFYFDLAGAVNVQRAALSNFLLQVRTSLTTVTSYLIQTTGRELDDSTGGLTGAWSETTAYANPGTSATQPVADATQLLFQWRTNQIVNGRFVRGRTFIPGFFAGGLAGGNVTAAQVTGLSTAANTFATSATIPVVWHRPNLGSGGVAVPMTSGALWPELAVLRRRRG